MRDIFIPFQLVGPLNGSPVTSHSWGKEGINHFTVQLPSQLTMLKVRVRENRDCSINHARIFLEQTHYFTSTVTFMCLYVIAAVVRHRAVNHVHLRNSKCMNRTSSHVIVSMCSRRIVDETTIQGSHSLSTHLTFGRRNTWSTFIRCCCDDINTQNSCTLKVSRIYAAFQNCFAVALTNRCLT